MKKYLLLLLPLLLLAAGCEEKVKCGGWKLNGKIVCECDGRYDTRGCPPGAMCDGGTYYCYGTCGECHCENWMGTDEECQEMIARWKD